MEDSTVRFQSCWPVRRSKQYRCRFLPESSAQVTKTRPCETIGLLLPGPGSVAFHRMLFVGPNGAALCPLERHHSHPARGTAANLLPALSGTTARQAQQQLIFGDSCS